MGRYYTGDIQGKFWFGVQSSDDGEFFGAKENQNRINYYVDDLEQVQAGLKECRKQLRGYKRSLDTFFKLNNGYNDEILTKHLGVTPQKTEELLTWYARLILGLKIEKCVKKQGYCEFEAEL